MVDILLYLLTGACAGLAAGLFGVGGGLIIVPVLHHVLITRGYDSAYLMHIAVATSLAVIVTTSISSTLAHQRRGAVKWRTFLSITPGIIIGAWLGGWFASTRQSSMLVLTFAVFELIVALSLLLDLRSKHHRQKLPPVAAVSGGGFIGFVSAIVGIGGGTMTVPFLHWFGSSMRNAVATSAATGFPIAVSGTLAYVFTGWSLDLVETGEQTALMLGYVELEAFAIIAVSSFLFAPLGARIAHSIAEQKLRMMFALLLFTLSASMFYQL